MTILYENEPELVEKMVILLPNLFPSQTDPMFEDSHTFPIILKKKEKSRCTTWNENKWCIEVEKNASTRHMICQHLHRIRPWNSTWHVQDTLRSNQQRSVARAATPKIAECSQRKRRRNPWAQTCGCIETTKLARRNSLNEKSWQINKMSKWVCMCVYIIYMWSPLPESICIYIYIFI